MKRVIALSDFHSGHLVGLTPPPWHVKEKRGTDRTKRGKFARIQRELWGEFVKMLKDLAPYDYVLFGGDSIEGKGFRSGSTELITADREEQAEIAASVFASVRLYSGRKKVKIAAVYGTPSHVGTDEDWEDIVAEKAGFDKIGAHEWPMIEGVVFDLKHKIGSSTIPHGRGTAVLREMLWGDLWAMNDQQPKADVVLRGHAHYYIGIDTADKAGFVMPALQGMGSKFGARQCSGIVHWGLMHFDCAKGSVEDWDKHIRVIQTQVATTTKL